LLFKGYNPVDLLTRASPFGFWDKSVSNCWISNKYRKDYPPQCRLLRVKWTCSFGTRRLQMDKLSSIF